MTIESEPRGRAIALISARIEERSALSVLARELQMHWPGGATVTLFGGRSRAALNGVVAELGERLAESMELADIREALTNDRTQMMPLRRRSAELSIIGAAVILAGRLVAVQLGGVLVESGFGSESAYAAIASVVMAIGAGLILVAVAGGAVPRIWYLSFVWPGLVLEGCLRARVGTSEIGPEGV